MAPLPSQPTLDISTNPPLVLPEDFQHLAFTAEVFGGKPHANAALRENDRNFFNLCWFELHKLYGWLDDAAKSTNRHPMELFLECNANLVSIEARSSIFFMLQLASQLALGLPLPEETPDRENVGAVITLAEVQKLDGYATRLESPQNFWAFTLRTVDWVDSVAGAGADDQIVRMMGRTMVYLFASQGNLLDAFRDLQERAAKAQREYNKSIRDQIDRKLVQEFIAAETAPETTPAATLDAATDFDA